MTRDELLARLSATELADWKRFERQFGLLGPERSDFHAAEIAFYVVKAMGGKKTRVKFNQFLLNWRRGSGGSDLQARDRHRGDWGSEDDRGPEGDREGPALAP
jgi:hypothetical protein